MPRLYMRAEIKGIDHILDKLRASDPVYAKPWAEAVRSMTERVSTTEKEVSPKDTLRLMHGIVYRTDTRPVPEWGLITNTAVATNIDKKRGGFFRYPWALNASDRYHHKGWWDLGLKRARVVVVNTLVKAAKEIEARWTA